MSWVTPHISRKLKGAIFPVQNHNERVALWFSNKAQSWQNRFSRFHNRGMFLFHVLSLISVKNEVFCLKSSLHFRSPGKIINISLNLLLLCTESLHYPVTPNWVFCKGQGLREIRELSVIILYATHIALVCKLYAFIVLCYLFKSLSIGSRQN